jgi:hypothetical protein
LKFSGINQTIIKTKQMKKTMKILGLTLGAVAFAVVQSASAQGYINLNSYDAAAGFFLGSTATAAPTTTYVELMGGASAGTMVGVVSGNTLSAINQITDLNGGGPGSGTYFDIGDGPVSGVAASGLGFFQILAWQGNASFALAPYKFESAVWSELTGTPPTLTPPSPEVPTMLMISLGTPVLGNVADLGGGNNGLVLVAVPEPTTLALAGLGGLALLAFRRRS